MSEVSALYTGRVVHARLSPRRHRLSYSCYWLLLDLDDLTALDRRLRFFSHNRFNLMCLADADHGAGLGKPLKAEAQRHLSDAGIDIAGGKVLLLAMPRILGYGFNPISIYFCHRADGELAALIYEVHNTFQQRHSYLIATESGSADGHVLQQCSKRFYVSPFLGMDLTYDFDVEEPGEAVRVGVRVSGSNGLVLTASLAGRRQALTDRALLRVFLTHPLLTLKVMAAIHWEALRLWWKGVRLVPRGEPPEKPVTTITPNKRAEKAA
ncbi:MAG: DUF1365 family protein [Hyphomicrobium sp.]